MRTEIKTTYHPEVGDYIVIPPRRAGTKFAIIGKIVDIQQTLDPLKVKVYAVWKGVGAYKPFLDWLTWNTEEFYWEDTEDATRDD